MKVIAKLILNFRNEIRAALAPIADINVELMKRSADDPKRPKNRMLVVAMHLA